MPRSDRLMSKRTVPTKHALHTQAQPKQKLCFFPAGELAKKEGMASCRSCVCNACLCGTLFLLMEIVTIALAVIAVVSNAWAVSLNGSLPGIVTVGLFGIQCGNTAPGYVSADGEYIATNITQGIKYFAFLPLFSFVSSR